MIRINLLPYREAKRKAQAQRLALMGLAGLGVVAVVFYGVYFLFDQRVKTEQARVDFLQQEISRLDDRIKTVVKVKQQREIMLAKLAVVEKLQKNRGLVVRIFNDLAARTPQGVFLNHVQEKPDGLFLEGYAESNGQVAELMRNLADSSIFTSPTLEIISKTDLSGSPVGAFKMTVKLRPEFLADDGKALDKKGKGKQ